MTLHKSFLMFRETGKTHCAIMFYQFFFWQSVDIQGTYTDIHRQSLDYRENKFLKYIKTNFS